MGGIHAKSWNDTLSDDIIESTDGRWLWNKTHLGSVGLEAFTGEVRCHTLCPFDLALPR